jgi:hypothetical protein
VVEFSDPGGEDGRGSAEAGRGGQDVAMKDHRAHLAAGVSGVARAPVARHVGNADPEPLAVRSFSSAVGHRRGVTPHMREARPGYGSPQQKSSFSSRFLLSRQATEFAVWQTAVRKRRVTMDVLNR